MRLTNTLRDAFINAVMNDVPKVDYQEKLSKRVAVVVQNLYPKKVGEAIKESPEWFSKCYFCKGGMAVHYIGPPSHRTTDRFESEIFADSEVASIVKEHQDQNVKLYRLRARLKEVAYGVSTRKQLAEVLPEFEKYMPLEPLSATKNLPATTGVYNDFVKAGWPKEQK